MITQNRTGGRTIELFIPFEVGGKKVESITLGPLRFGHVLRWNEGAWKSMVELLVELAGVDESIIRELRYPDADRVLEAFFTMLTPEIRDNITEGRIPVKPVDEMLMVERVGPPPQTNGGDGQPVMPGVPMPEEAGFDLSEEP